MAGRYLLIAEDDPSFASLASVKLAPLGLPVRFVGTAVDAYKAAAKEPPALIIMDFAMPGFGSGTDAAGAIAKTPELQGIPVLLLTGSRPEIFRGIDFPPDRIFFKPPDWGALLDKARALIG